MMFQVALKTEPEVWSACIDNTGKIPTLAMTTNVTIIGTKLASGNYSYGAIGSDKRDLDKALTLHFDPDWRSCTVSSG